MRIAGVLLAAGRSERFGAQKLLAPLTGVGQGTPVGVAACRNLRAALSQVVAVVRPGANALARALEQTGAAIVVAAHADDGMGASLAAGVSAVHDADAYIVALADMPWIEPATIQQVARALDAGAPLVAPRFRGQRGHPVGFGATYRSALVALRGDEGAKGLLAQHREQLQLVDVDDPGVVRDVDTPADLR